MAALPAQQKSTFFQDTRTRPSRLEPSTLRSARSWAFCFFSFLNPLSLSHSGRCADSSLRSLESFVDAHCSFKTSKTSSPVLQFRKAYFCFLSLPWLIPLNMEIFHVFSACFCPEFASDLESTTTNVFNAFAAVSIASLSTFQCLLLCFLLCCFLCFPKASNWTTLCVAGTFLAWAVSLWKLSLL